MTITKVDREALERWKNYLEGHPADGPVFLDIALRAVAAYDEQAKRKAVSEEDGVYSIYRRVVDYLRSIPAYHIPRSYLTHHGDPMCRGREEIAIEVALRLNDTSDDSLPPSVRFDGVIMKFMLKGGRFVRTTPKELPEMSDEAWKIVREIERMICEGDVCN